MERNPIVQRIARMEMTTMSSMRVKALLERMEAQEFIERIKTGKVFLYEEANGATKKLQSGGELQDGVRLKLAKKCPN